MKEGRQTNPVFLKILATLAVMGLRRRQTPYQPVPFDQRPWGGWPTPRGPSGVAAARRAAKRRRITRAKMPK